MRSTASCRSIFTLVIGFLLAALMDQKIRFEDTFRTIFLYPFALSLHRHRPGLAVDPQPRFRHPGGRARARAGRASPSTRSYNAEIVIYGIADRRALAGHRARSCASCWPACAASTRTSGRPPRVDGIPTWKTYLFIVMPMMRPVLHHHARHHRRRHRQRLRPRRRADQRRPGHRLARCRRNTSTTTCSTRQNLGQGFAASTMMLLSVRRSSSCPGPICEFGRRKQGDD